MQQLRRSHTQRGADSISLAIRRRAGVTGAGSCQPVAAQRLCLAVQAMHVAVPRTGESGVVQMSNAQASVSP